jgi:hypothetical protein
VSWKWVDCGSLVDGNIMFTPKVEGANAWWQSLVLSNARKPLQSVAIDGRQLPRTPWNNWEWASPVRGGCLAGPTPQRCCW